MPRHADTIEQRAYAYGSTYVLWRTYDLVGDPMWIIRADGTKIAGPYKSRAIARAEFAVTTGEEYAANHAEIRGND